MSVGERLRSTRERLGMNQGDFGRLGGVERNTQANYEGDKRSPDAAYLGRIAEAGADVGWIVTGIRTPALPVVGADERWPQLNDGSAPAAKAASTDPDAQVRADTELLRDLSALPEPQAEAVRHLIRTLAR